MNFLKIILFKAYTFYNRIYPGFKLAYWKYRFKGQLSIGMKVNIHPDSIVNFATGTASCRLDDEVEIKQFCTINLLLAGELVIEKNVFINSYTSINCGKRINIGENSMLGEGVRIYDHNHKTEKDGLQQSFRHEFTAGDVVIGKNCWIGSNVVILKGVTIGDHCIIGANNLIYRSIPPNSTVKSTNSYQIQ